jgi:hypothetical protein
MTPEQQQEFVIKLTSTVQATIRSKKIPPEWDGIELRQYIADQFAQQVADMPRSRRKDYNNTVITENL